MASFSHLSCFARRLSVICVAVLAACSTAPQQGESRGPVVWPRPPDQPRFAYEAVLRSAADIRMAESTADKMLREMTGAGSDLEMPVFEKPTGVAARNGSIYVSDTATKTIVAFDVPRRRVFRFGIRQPGTLAQPTGLAVDDRSFVYAADAKRRQVIVYDKLGLFQRAIGGPADLERPAGVAVSRDGERIYVIDRSDNESMNHRVVVYDKGGTKLKVIGTRGSGDGQFNVPLQGAVAPDGTLFVLDSGNFRVQAFDRDGKFLRAFGSAGVNPGNLARPRGIAVDNEGNVYVTDASYNNFQVFNSEGQLLLAVGRASRESKPGQYGLLNGISVDETGRVYVVDQLFNKVEVIRRLSNAEGEKILQAAAR